MKRLDEITRKNLVGKTKLQSPARYNKRLRYATMSKPYIDEDEFINNDMLVIHVDVGAYECVISYAGVLKALIEYAAKLPNHYVTRKVIIKVMNKQIDDVDDVFVRCSCLDFRYRFAYFASKFDYIWGKKELRPSKITNPRNDIGATCKHLAAVLSNKKWLVKASSAVNDLVYSRYQDIIDKYNLDPNLFVTNLQQHTAAAKSNVKRMAKRLPAELVSIVNKLFDPTQIGSILYDSLGKRGWHIRLDSDLGIPNTVYMGKSEKDIENEDEESDNMYVFDVVPAGTKVRLKWRNV